MKNIMILGGSVAGVSTIEYIKSQNADVQITLILTEEFAPCKREAFVDYLSNEKSLEDLSYQSQEYFDNHNVQILENQNITRINLKNKKIYTEEKKQISFDQLVIADAPQHRFPDIKGVSKDGVLGMLRLKDINRAHQLANIIDDIVIQSEGLTGLRMAIALRERKKEVIYIHGQSQLLPSLNEEEQQWLSAYIQDLGIKVICNDRIEEVLGDAEVRAIRLKSGKVFSSDLVLFSETLPDLRVFSESLSKAQGKAWVDDHFSTNVENVYACDAVCASQSKKASVDDLYNTEILKRQGRCVGAALLNIDIECPEILADQQFQIKDLNISLLGDLNTYEDTKVHQCFKAEENIFHKVLVRNQAVQGALIINDANALEKVKVLIAEQRPINSPEELGLGSGAPESQVGQSFEIMPLEEEKLDTTPSQPLESEDVKTSVENHSTPPEETQGL